MEMRLLWHGLPGTTQLLENISVRIDHVVAGNQQGSRQVWLGEVDKQGSVGTLQPGFPPAAPLDYGGIAADLALGDGPSHLRAHSSAATGLCSVMAVTHARQHPFAAQTDTVHFSSWF